MKIRPTYNVPQEGGSAPAEETPGVETQTPASGAEGDSAFDMLSFFDGMNSEYDEAPADEVVTPQVGAKSGTAPEQGGGQEVTPVISPEARTEVSTQPAQGQPPVSTPTGGQPQAQAAGQQQAPADLGAQQQPQGQAQAQPEGQAVKHLEPQDAIHRLHEEVVRQKDVFTDQLAQQVYSMTEAQQQEFLENPGAVLSKLAAQVHVNVTASISKMMATHIPAVVAGTQNAQRENEAREGRFFSSWPNLKREHISTIAEIGRTYNSVNPRATEAEFIRDVGMMASLRLGVPLASAGQANGSQPQVQLHQQQVAVRTPGQVVRQVSVPFQPGSPRGTSPQGQQPPKNDWEQLVDFVRLEESGALDT